MTARNRIALVLTLISLIFLGPGLVKPVLTIRASVALFGSVHELSNETRSVVGTIRSLHASGNNFVAGLILLFSIVVPLIKIALLVPIFASRDAARRSRVYRAVQSVSKWAMADVFAVGIFIAFLAVKATANMAAVAGPGFYYFVAYCLLSNASFQVLEVPEPPTS